MNEESMNYYPADYMICSAAAAYIKSQTHIEPTIGIILGTGLGPLADKIDVDVVIPYADILGFPISTAPSHKGNLIIGKIGDVGVICMQGRFHYYEGYEYATLAFAIRTLYLCGIKLLIQTNAAGAVNLNYHVGDVMLISDHINLYAANPTRGQDYIGFGERFYDTSAMYAPQFRHIAAECGKSFQLTFREGVYMFMPGPAFETPAEIRAIRLLGADAVGMSTVPESLTAAQLGLPVLGFSIITNMAAGIEPGAELKGEDVDAVADMISDHFSDYMVSVVIAAGKEL